MTRVVTTLEIIASRQAKLFAAVRRTMLDKRWLAVRDSSSARSFGGVVNLRPLMLAKVGIFDGGVNLFLHWATIERERRIPWDVHAASMSPSAWGTAGASMHAQFYSTKTADFTALELLEPGWHPVEEDAIDGFATVSTEEALAALGMVGGQHPEVDHPVLDFTVLPATFIVGAGDVLEVDLHTDPHAEYPVQYELAAGWPDWGAVTTFGTLTLSPPATLRGRFRQGIIATDGLGRAVTVEIDISVT